MEVEDAFEKWMSDWVSRNPGGELSPKTVWFVASRWGYGQNADRIAALEAERDALRADAARYRWLRSQHEASETDLDNDDFSETFCVFRPAKQFHLEPVGCFPGELDSAIDSAIAAKEPK